MERQPHWASYSLRGRTTHLITSPGDLKYLCLHYYRVRSSHQWISEHRLSTPLAVGALCQPGKPTLTYILIGGSITIKTTNPFDQPILNPGLLASDFDVLAMREAVELATHFLTAPAWKGYVIGPVRPLAMQPQINPSMDISATSRKVGPIRLVLQPCPRAMQVTGGNPDLLVKGVTGLRISDASIMVSNLTAQTQGVLAQMNSPSHLSQRHISKRPYI